MKCYIGMKVIRAEVMEKNDFNLRKGRPTSQDDKGKEGYLVEYSNPNGELNYESWSPRDVFERSYREIYPDEMAFINK